MATERKPMERGAQRAWGCFLMAMGLFIGMSLFSYDWKDISALIVPANNPPSNLIGPVGAWLSYVLFMAFGVGAYLVPVWCLVFGLMLLLNSDEKVWPRGLWVMITALSLIAILDLCESWCAPTCERLNISETAGLFGRIVTRSMLVQWLSPVGAGILLGALFVISVVILVEMRNVIAGYHTLAGLVAEMVARRRAAPSLEVTQEPEENEDDDDDEKGRARQNARHDPLEKIEQRRQKLEEEARQAEKRRQRRERLIQDSRQEAPETPPEPVVVPVQAAEPVKPAPAKPARARPEPAPAPAPEPVAELAVAEPPKKKEPPARKPVPPREEPPVERPVTAAKVPGTSTYQLPPLSLLNEPATQNREITTDATTTSRILVETLAEFGIEAETTNVEKGPVVTRYELLPAPGVRVEKISALSNNIALALKAASIRVQAPIPGKGVVGIEVPNSTASMVYLREVLEGPTWQSGKARLPLVLGKDVGGNDLVADLSGMPHLLVAGATGAGKTVCMNSILTGLLMSRTPDQLRLMLVDPKIVEFSVYEGIPHLVVPVITNPKKVSLGLRWAINEMEKRYKLFAKVGVRNIESYNSREIVKQEVLFAEDTVGGEEKKVEEPPARIPYIVIIIDELADLMLVDPAEIENSVARLAQLSRAVGIHMILSTQRPSVNVITGTIKANFPSRIAFQVAQKTDSRTILDGVGAEKLLGRGDMLFLPPGSSKMIRAQGVWTTDEEIKRVTEFIKKQGAPEYEMEIKDKLDRPASKLDGGEDDELVDQAVQIIRETQRASTSSLQRRLRIGYTRAARIMDILEERGIVGPPRGSDAREIIVDLDGEVPTNAPEEPKTE